MQPAERRLCPGFQARRSKDRSRGNPEAAKPTRRLLLLQAIASEDEAVAEHCDRDLAAAIQLTPEGSFALVVNHQQEAVQVRGGRLGHVVSQLLLRAEVLILAVLADAV